MVSTWRRVPDQSLPARAKITGSYAQSALAKSEANEAGFDEAIVLTVDGHVSEGSAENLFMIKDGTVVTPPVTDDILEGITRTLIIGLVKDELGLPVIERSIDRTELYTCDELLLCGTGAQQQLVTGVKLRAVDAALDHGQTELVFDQSYQQGSRDAFEDVVGDGWRHEGAVLD